MAYLTASATDLPAPTYLPTYLHLPDMTTDNNNNNTEKKELPVFEQHTAVRLQRLIDRGEWLSDNHNIIHCLVSNLWMKHLELIESDEPDYETFAMTIEGEIDALFDLCNGLNRIFWTIDSHDSDKGDITEIKLFNKRACPKHRVEVIAKAEECQYKKRKKKVMELNKQFYADSTDNKPKDLNEKTEKDSGT